MTTTTMEAVDEQQARLAELEREATALREREQALSTAIAEALAMGEGDDTLTAQRRDVRERRADIQSTLPLLRDRIAEAREAAGRAAAEDRMTGIRRAYGSLREQLGRDGERLQEAAEAYRAAAAQLAERYHRLCLLRAEAGALADRFSVEAPALSAISPPARREDVRAAVEVVRGIDFPASGHVRPAVEKCEHGLRQRRTYREVHGTPGHEIITAAGLKEWPALTEKQRAAVASRQRQQEEERRAAQRF